MRRATPAKPNKPEPNNHTAAGIGTTVNVAVFQWPCMFRAVGLPLSLGPLSAEPKKFVKVESKRCQSTKTCLVHKMRTPYL